TVEASVLHGTLSVSLAGGATAVGNGTGDLILSGSQTQINGALSSLSYQGNLNYNGSDTLTILSTDGAGATDSDTVAITVNPVNHAPAGADNTITINEDTPYTFAAADFGFTDPDTGDSLSAVRINTISGAGTLTEHGITLHGGDLVLASDIPFLIFTPDPNA